ARCRRLESSGVRLLTIGRTEPPFPPRFTLRGLAVMPHEIGRVLGENLFQPAEPFSFGAAAEIHQPAMRVHERLLNEIRGIDLGLQPTSHLRSRDYRQIIAA